MIKGISDLDYNDAKRLLTAILDRAKGEEESLHKETEEKKIEILELEYQKRLAAGHHHSDKEKAIEACNRRIEEIENELFALADRKNYYEVQLEMLSGKQTA